MKKQLTLLAVVLMVCGLIAVPVSAKTDISQNVISSDAAAMNCGGCKAADGEKKDGCCQKKEGECKKDKDAKDSDDQKQKQEQKDDAAAG